MSTFITLFEVKMALLGYATVHPAFSLKKQVALLKAAGCHRIFQDESVNDYTGLHKLIEVYEEGQDIFLTLLHRKNNIIQEQFLAMLELKKYLGSPGRRKKTVNIEQTVIRLLEKETNTADICEILDISTSTLARIKQRCGLTQTYSSSQLDDEYVKNPTIREKGEAKSKKK